MEGNSSSSSQDYSSVICEVKRAYQEWVEKNEELEKEIAQVSHLELFSTRKMLNCYQ